MLSINRVPRTICCLLLTCLVTAGPAFCDSVTTKTGSCYRGTVTEDGDCYVIQEASGRKRRLPKSLVVRIVSEAELKEKNEQAIRELEGKKTGQNCFISCAGK